MTDPAIIEAAARAIGQTDEDNVWEGIPSDNRDWYRELAMCVLVKVTPMIEAAALERAAQIATSFLVGDPANGIPLRNPMAHEIADAIRALKENQDDPTA